MFDSLEFKELVALLGGDAIRITVPPREVVMERRGQRSSLPFCSHGFVFGASSRQIYPASVAVFPTRPIIWVKDFDTKAGATL